MLERHFQPAGRATLLTQFCLVQLISPVITFEALLVAVDEGVYDVPAWIDIFWPLFVFLVRLRREPLLHRTILTRPVDALCCQFYGVVFGLISSIALWVESSSFRRVAGTEAIV